VGSVAGGVQSPGWGLGAKPQKPEIYAENLIECHHFHTVQRKKFQRACPLPTPLL